MPLNAAKPDPMKNGPEFPRAVSGPPKRLIIYQISPFIRAAHIFKGVCTSKCTDFSNCSCNSVELSTDTGRR